MSLLTSTIPIKSKRFKPNSTKQPAFQQRCWQGWEQPEWFRGSEHMQDFLIPDRLFEFTVRACDALQGYEFDTIAFRGMSGAVIAPAVAVRLQKHMLLVRKSEEHTHSMFKVEGDYRVKRYIILDDFIAVGNTYREVVRAVTNFAPEAECLGLLEVLYISPEDLRVCRESGVLYPLSRREGKKEA